MGKHSIPKDQRVAPTVRQGCATGVGYQQHLYWGEHPCETCRTGNYAKSRAWILENQEKAKATAKKWRADNWEYLKADKRKWAEENLERVREIHRVSSAKHPETNRRRSRARRARMRGVHSIPYNDQDVLDLYGTDCHICGEPISLNAPRGCGPEGWELGLHIDHLIPLDNVGDDTIENVRPSHGLCNVKKGAWQQGLFVTLTKEEPNDS